MRATIRWSERGRVDRQPRPEVLTVRDGHDGRAVEQLCGIPGVVAPAIAVEVTEGTSVDGRLERHAREAARLGQAAVAREGVQVIAVGDQRGTPAWLAFPEEQVGVLRARVHDRPLRRLIEALPDRERLAHAAEVEVARLRIDEAMRDQSAVARRIEHRRPGPHGPASAARRLGAVIAGVSVVERPLVRGGRDEVPRRPDAIGRRGEAADAVGRVEIVRDVERVMVPVRPGLVSLRENCVAIDPDRLAPRDSAVSTVAPFDPRPLLDDADLLGRLDAWPRLPAARREDQMREDDGDRAGGRQG